VTAEAEYEDKQLVQQAAEALAATDASEVDNRWRQFVGSVRQHFKNDERMVAAELQRLAKLVEAQGTADDAMNFKQRTCQTMLMLSMEERHKSRGAPPAKVAPTPLPFANLEVLTIGTAQFQEELQFYKSLSGEVIWEKQLEKKKFALLRLASGPRTLLMEHPSQFVEPAYSCSNTRSAIAILNEKRAVLVERLEWPNGSAQRFQTPSGSGFILCEQM
jgi:hypothetical protein